MKKRYYIGACLLLLVCIAMQVGADENNTHSEVDPVIIEKSHQVADLNNQLLASFNQNTTRGGVRATSTTLSPSLTTEQLRLLLQERKQLLEDIARKDPLAFLSLVGSGNMEKTVPQELRGNVERRVSLSGKINVFHVDDFDNPKNSYFQY